MYRLADVISMILCGTEEIYIPPMTAAIPTTAQGSHRLRCSLIILNKHLAKL